VARIEYYFRETASGIRRNGTIAFGAVMTAFIALFLFGLALLIRREIALVIESITGNVQVQVYVDDNASAETIDQIHTTLAQLPAVKSADFEDKAAACARAQAIFQSNPTIIENTTCSTWPRSFRITLADTSQYAQIHAALGREPDATGQLTCTQPGVSTVRDWRDVLDRLSAITTAVSLGLFGLSVIMLISAVVLVSNTLRMVGRNYGLRGLPYVGRILIPAAFPTILTGLKIGWAFAWRTLIAAELVFGVSSGSGGLGWFIYENKNQLEIPNVFAGLFTVIVIGLIVENVVFRVVEARTVRKWGLQTG